jgi:hypothetical protein
MAKKITNKQLRFIKHQQKRIYLNLRESYIETRKDEYLRTGLYNPMKFRNFLIIHMNYTVEEANEITQIYKKYDNKFSKKIVETVA